MERILRKIEKLVPRKIYKSAQPIYHFLLAILGMIIYRFPAKKMVMIGITGTKGKTSTANFIHSVLSESGNKVGLISTANIKIGDREIANKYHMSMPGRFILQSLLKQILNNGCKYCVVEVTSEGIKQWRHLGLFLDVAIFTNLSPEHLASHHNSFAEYRSTKARIFKKNIFNKLKYILVNNDDENGKYFKSNTEKVKELDYSLSQVLNITEKESGIDFEFEKENYHINILGRFNIYNSLPAILVAKIYGLNYTQIKSGLEKVNLIPGRMEEIKEGQSFKLFVDYAHEKLSINNLLDTAKNLKIDSDNKIITVLGGDGGGRDKERLTDMGEAVGKKSDIVIVSNSDPYFDDEEVLANTIKYKALSENDYRKNNNLDILEDSKNIFVILDRAEAIKKAVSLAKENDIILLATRGSLTSMSIKGKKIPSDDRVLAREALKDLNK